MKHGLGLSSVLLLCAAAEAADPPVPTRNAAPPQLAAAEPAAAKPLDLHVGDIRKYMMPKDFAAAIDAPDADKSAIVVEGQRELLPMKSETDVPGGLIAPFWAILHPTQGWRIFAPVVNAPAMGPTFDKIPPPIFRWGP